MYLRAAQLVFVLLICAAATSGFSYLTVEHGSLRSSHGLNVAVSAPRTFRLLKPSSRHANFNGHPYEVSLGGFAGKGAAILIHAERVADRSGASNYDNLPISPWRKFRLRSQCASISPEDAATEHDLKWLADRGWSPIGSLSIEQHFRTTADHNEEVVVSLIMKVPSCNDKDAIAASLDRLRAKVRVRSI